MVMRKNNYVLVQKELRIVREKIKSLRQTPTNNLAEQIIILREINQLLVKSNNLLIIRQRLLAGRNTTIGEKIDILEARLK